MTDNIILPLENLTRDAALPGTKIGSLSSFSVKNVSPVIEVAAIEPFDTPVWRFDSWSTLSSDIMGRHYFSLNNKYKKWHKFKCYDFILRLG